MTVGNVDTETDRHRETTNGKRHRSMTDINKPRRGAGSGSFPQ